MGIYQALINVSLDHFAIPGDVAFPLNQAFEPPRDRQDAETLRQYVSISFTSFEALGLIRFDYQIPLSSTTGDRYSTTCSVIRWR